MNKKASKKPKKIGDNAAYESDGNYVLKYFKGMEKIQRELCGERWLHVLHLESLYPAIKKTESLILKKPDTFTPKERNTIQAIIKRMSRGIRRSEWAIENE